jgi:tRNA(adenine34) deaminase
MHAEFIAIKEAMMISKARYLTSASLYVNLEPCAFCAAVAEKVRIKEIFFGAYDPKRGGIVHNSRIFDHSSSCKPLIVGGIQERRCAECISAFFKGLR